MRCEEGDCYEVGVFLKNFVKLFMPLLLIQLIKKVMFFFRKKGYDIEIKRRLNCSIFDIDVLTKDMDLVTVEYGFNSFYGLNEIINSAIGNTGIVDGAIEHGISYTGKIDSYSVGNNVVYTMSDSRKNFIESVLYGKKCIAVGPYIKYANSLLSKDEIMAQKTFLGKTLLLFPAHSTHHVNASFNVDVFIKEVERVRKKYNYDTVLVCIYWKDHLRGLSQKYEAKNYLICTAGHIYDSNFMNRLRSIIELSDVAMSNDFGTNIGYCITLGKPYYLYYVETRYEEHQVKCDVNNYYEGLLDTAIKNFGEYKEYISEENKKFIEQYWGK